MIMPPALLLALAPQTASNGPLTPIQTGPVMVVGCGFADDGFEDNDTEATASPIGFQLYPDLVCDVEDDWYSFSLPDGEAVQIDLTFDTTSGDLDMYLFDRSTMVELDRGTSGTNDELIVHRNCTGVSQDLVLRVTFFSPVCNEYDLELSDPTRDDAFEDNDSCATATSLPIGVTRDLAVLLACGLDDDHFAYALAPGETFTADALYDESEGQIVLELHDTTFGCFGTTIASVLGTDGMSTVRVTNTSVFPRDLVVRVALASGQRVGYDLVTKRTTSSTVGQLICIGEANSTSQGASMCAIGSPVASVNDVTFEVSGLPANVFGFFVVSRDINFVSPGSTEGTLCITSLGIGRYDLDVLDSGPTGEFAFTIDTSVIPFSAGGVSFRAVALAGDTYNFQAWYRDTTMGGMNTSNFTDAISILFQ